MHIGLFFGKQPIRRRKCEGVKMSKKIGGEDGNGIALTYDQGKWQVLL
jgi:hypothetical protein